LTVTLLLTHLCFTGADLMKGRPDANGGEDFGDSDIGPTGHRKLPLNSDSSLVSTSGKKMAGGASEKFPLYRKSDRFDSE
jgi:hypothetical protein